MQTQREVIRFLTACQELWLRHFPALHRRAQWHLASHLAVRAHDGSALGELYGLVKQVFLLDDATVRERIGELRGLGLCTLDPADGPLSARTVVSPTPALREGFDVYLSAMAGRLFAAGAGLGVRGLPMHGGPHTKLDPPLRQALLAAVETCQEGALAACEGVFDLAGLSRARRLDARRHLLSVSHGTLLLMALEQRYGLSHNVDGGDGLLADQMAAALLGLIRQNFQTTRDHIAYLMQIGLLRRCAGRALRVALAENAHMPLDRGLDAVASELARRAGEIGGQAALGEITGTFRSGLAPTPPPVVAAAPRLLISGPGDPPAEFRLGVEPVVIGRAVGADLLLPAIEVSRAHCRIAWADGVVTITDLQSTNGTFVDGQRIAAAATLAPGAVLRVGPYRLTLPEPESVDGTIRAEGTGPPAHPGTAPAEE